MRVILIGWGNATPSQLAAYERLYRSLGTEPEVAIPRTSSGLLDPREYERALAPVAGRLDATDDRFLIHLFSDNGFVGWSALLSQLSSTANIAGVVYDSSPGLWNVQGRRDFARRFALGMTPLVSRKLGLGAREKLPIVTTALRITFMGYQLAFPRAVQSMLRAADRVASLQPRCPHLFVYGEADDLVRPADVQAWIVRQRDRGIPLHEHAFPNAKHVALYPHDPRRYRTILADFLSTL